jgi:hypothetical protein
VIVAGVNGLLLQQAAVRNQRPSPPIQITYTTNKIVTLEESSLESDGNVSVLEAHGIVGSASDSRASEESCHLLVRQGCSQSHHHRI